MKDDKGLLDLSWTDDVLLVLWYGLAILAVVNILAEVLR